MEKKLCHVVVHLVVSAMAFKPPSPEIKFSLLTYCHAPCRYELGRQPANTKLSSNVTVRRVRVRGGNFKFRALRLDSGNFAWGSEVSKHSIIEIHLKSKAEAQIKHWVPQGNKTHILNFHLMPMRPSLHVMSAMPCSTRATIWRLDERKWIKFDTLDISSYQNFVVVAWLSCHSSWSAFNSQN